MVISCQDELSHSDEQSFNNYETELRSDSEPENYFDLGGPLVTDQPLDSTLLNRTLSRTEFESLNLGIDPSILDYATVSLSTDGPTIDPPYYECTYDPEVENSCCTTNAAACTPRHFRADGCFRQIPGVHTVIFTTKIFLDNVQVLHLGNSPAIYAGCNLYEPFAVRDNNGNIVYYLCWGVVFDFDCPAKFRVESEWYYRGYNIPPTRCGFNAETFHYPGTPDCIMKD